jgi:hypothetical protein
MVILEFVVGFILFLEYSEKEKSPLSDANAHLLLLLQSHINDLKIQPLSFGGER